MLLKRVQFHQCTTFERKIKMPRCEICGEYKFTPDHKCFPAWGTNIVETDDENDWQTVYAYSSESAAAKRAEEYDQDDHDLLQGSEVEIHVRDGAGNIAKYICSGEAVPEYHATKISS